MTSNNGTEIRVLAATGVCGSGFRVSSLAEVVLAGRSSDCAIFAGIPVQAGIPAGIAWHAAKIRECGAASATIIRHQAIHLPIPAWSGLITGVTCPIILPILSAARSIGFASITWSSRTTPTRCFPLNTYRCTRCNGQAIEAMQAMG